MKTLRTAPQILEHYANWQIFRIDYDNVLKAMRHYARVKSDKAYEEWYQTAINQMK